MILAVSGQPWDFRLLDTGNGYRLEQWGDYSLSRPDPQIIWPKSLPESEWQKAHAVFVSGSGEKQGEWKIKKPFPKSWTIKYQNLKFVLKLTPFKHTGLFPEQAAQWAWLTSKIKNKRLKILNLFAYTGGATMVLTKLGCHVTHVDASRPALNWANENHALNRLPKTSVRWMLDDAVKFAKREVRRGAKYQGIIMDPPAFGHSPAGQTWKFNHDLPALLADCVKVLSGDARFLVINGYATNSSALALNNLLEDMTKNRGGEIESGELCLKQRSGRLISTGIFARWSR